MDKPTQDFIATDVRVDQGMVHLNLSDGSQHAFPIHYYVRLEGATASQLSQVKLRVGGRALRWDELDEDIWVGDAVCQNYPKQKVSAVAESSQSYGKSVD